MTKLQGLIPGSVEWLQARLGLPTTSRFGDFLTPKGAYSHSKALTYACQLLAERQIGINAQPFRAMTAPMQRGLDLEVEARAHFERETGYSVAPGAVVLNKGAASSPDGELLGHNACLEIKCPLPPRHVAHLIADQLPPQYAPQVHGQLIVGEYERAFFISYCPGLPALIVEVWRDDYTEALEAHLRKFVERLDDLTELLDFHVEPPEIDLATCPDWVLPDLEGAEVSNVA